MKRIIFYVFLFISITALSQEESKKVFSLAEAVDYGHKNNPVVLNSEIDIEIARKKVWETTAIGLPQINATASYTNIFEVPEMSFGPYIDWYSIPAGTNITPEVIYAYTREGNTIQLGVKENISGDITVSQLIFNGEYLVGLQASRTFKHMSDLGLEKSLIDVQQQVADAYILVLLLERNLKNIEQTIENTDVLLKEIEATQKVGFGDKTGVDQFRLSLSNLKNLQSSVQRQANSARMLLKLNMGYEINSEILLSQSLEEVFAALDYQSYLQSEFNIENHIDFKILDTREQLSLLSVKQQRSKALPTLSGFYRHQRQLNEPDFNFFNPNMIGVSLNVPIFCSFSRNSQLQQTKLELLKTQNTKTQVADALQLQISQARDELSTAMEKYRAEQENLNLAERIYNETLIKFKKGASSGLELTQAQNQIINTQSSYYSAMFEVLKAKNTLDKVLNNF